MLHTPINMNKKIISRLIPKIIVPKTWVQSSKGIKACPKGDTAYPKGVKAYLVIPGSITSIVHASYSY